MASRTNAILSIYAAMVMAMLHLGCVRTKQDARKKSVRFLWLVVISIPFFLCNTCAYLCVYRIAIQAGSTEYLEGICLFAKIFTYICYYALLSMIVFYLADLIRENATVPAWIARITIPVAILWAMGWCVFSAISPSQGLGWGKRMTMLNYWMGLLGTIIILSVYICMIFYYRNTLGRGRVTCFSLTAILLVAAMVLRMMFPDIDFMALALSLSIILVRNLVDIERAKTVNRQEARLREEHVRLMLSQIRPHFLYNTLNTIYVLCEQEPSKAQQAIEEFSEFLRANIGSMESDRPVPFETEMKLVRHYLYLEQMRYQEELQVEIRLLAHNFSLPALTIQPLVENAVKHGLAKAPGGGTVRIFSGEMKDKYVVEVADDGVGFEPDDYTKATELKWLETGEQTIHIGLRSVHERLQNICGGWLEVESRPGKGTVARVYLPKEKAEVKE